jgi:hypothetical protein
MRSRSISQSGLRDAPERRCAAPCRAVIRLSLNIFLLLCVRSSKSQLRLVFVVCHARDNAFSAEVIAM